MTDEAATDPALGGSADAALDGPITASGASQRIDAGPIEEELAQIDAALERLDTGSYGTCDVCRDPLDDAVLAADPMARHCAGHLPGTIA